MQRGLPVLQAPQVCVGPPLEEHAAVRVVALDDSVAQQEPVLDVDVGTVVQEDLHAARPLSDDGELQGRRSLVTERVHLGLELQEQPHKGVPPVVCGHVQRGPAIIAFGVDDVAPVLGLQHEAGDPGPAVHGSIVKRSEAADQVLHCGVG